MLRSIGVSLALLLGVSPEAKADVALDALRLNKPEVKWRKPVVRADLTGSGIDAAAVVGSTDSAVVVALYWNSYARCLSWRRRPPGGPPEDPGR